MLFETLDSARLEDLAPRNDVRQLLTLFPFTNNGTSTTDGNGDSIGISHLSSYLLAVRHFNAKDASVVAELEDYVQCGVVLNESSPVMDTQMMASKSVSALLKQVYSNQVPDAVLGGHGELAVVDLAVATSGLNIPYMTYSVSNLRVASPFFYPYTTRLSADANVLAERAMSFLWERGRTNYTGVLQVRSETASQINEALVYSLSKRGVSYLSKVYESPRYGGTQEDMEMVMRSLCEIGYNTIVLIVEDAELELPLIAQIARALELGDEVFWFFMGNIDMNMLNADWVTQDQTVMNLLSGSALVKEIDQFMYSPSDDAFLESWRAQDSSLVDAVNSLIPDEIGHLSIDPDYFQTHHPAFGAGFVYDSVMALGMGLCDAELGGDREPIGRVRKIQSTRFVGASGPVRFGEDSMACSGGRSSESLTFGGFNLYPGGNSSVPCVLTDIYVSSWDHVAPFHYSDGSTTPSKNLRSPGEQNYLSSRVRNVGFALWGLALTVCAGACFWVVMNQSHRVMKANQPLFLYLIILGSTLMSVPMFLNSWDESYGWDAEQLSWACTASPWFYIIGHLLLYSSLASKLWRINKVLQFQRTTVTIQQVLSPSLALMVLALGILSAWTIVDGFDWVRLEIDSSTAESIGKCQGEHTTLFFTPIFGLILIPTLITLAMAVKTRDIDPTYSESKWILTLILLQVQVFFVSIPVLRILELMSTDGKYFGHVLLYFTMSTSSVKLIIGPKIWAVYLAKRRKSDGPSKIRGSAVGGQVHVSGLTLLPSMNRTARRDSETVQVMRRDSESVQVMNECDDS